ncbi:MAG TPA: hypothetical protein DCP74_05660 [Bacteroidales bacterium]|nr:hypothetical protein [Bacteroidales bacterium]
MRNIVRPVFYLVSVLVCLIVIITCIKVEKKLMVATGNVNNVLANSATAEGTVIDIGEGVSDHGHVYSTSKDVTMGGTKISLGSKGSTGSFTSQLTNLIAGTTYYIKAYVMGNSETQLGKEMTFKTADPVVPTITTTAVSEITTSTATSGGDVTADGGAPITVRGVCWNTSTGPSISNSKTTDETGTGSYSSSISGLAPGTTYYVRAYATNSAGTAYGNEVIFTTGVPPPVIPTLTTTAITGITQTTAASGGNISSDGGALVTARGICWNTSANPTIALSTKTTNGTGTGTFTSSLTGLTAGTTYYVRAYATNSAGTSYGNEINFTTSAVIPVSPTLTTSVITLITQTTASSGGNITSDGNAPVTARGVCWNTSANPTIALSTKTTDGTGTGTFTSSLTGLTASTTYYVRAYATNSAGTAYGNEQTFTTSAPATVVPGAPIIGTASAGNAQATVTFTAPVSNGGSAITGYTVTSNPGSITASGSASPITVTGLTNGTAYTFTVTATNANGSGPASSASNSVTPSTVPGAPTIGTAIAGNAQATVTFTAPVSDGGSVLTGYTVTSNPGSITASGSASPITVTGLTNGTAYTFTVTAKNASGTGPASLASNSVTPLAALTVSDWDGNVYNTVQIGTQIWMSENLKTTSYRDGTPIPLVTDNTVWSILTTPGYCWYNNDAATYKATYGALYNWYAVDPLSNGGKNVCPTGWHVPTDTEWTDLTAYLGGEVVAGGKLKETGTTHWTTPNTGATNETGFTALPGGYRDFFDGAFYDIGLIGVWWSATEFGATDAWYRYVFYNNSFVYEGNVSKKDGIPVRCVRD